jgi:hypothetical protein
VKEAKNGSRATASICCSKLYKIKVVLAVLTRWRRRRRRRKKKKKLRANEENLLDVTKER